MAEVRTTAVSTAEGTFTADEAGRRGDPLVLLLHGFPQTRHTWRDVLPALGDAGFHALAIDQRGYSPGVRPPDIASYRTERLTADVQDVADVLDAPRFHLVGHDWGGQVAWLTALQHPERVSGLTVLSRPHPAAFARSFALDPDQARRSAHHQSTTAEKTDLWHADDSAVLRQMLTRAGVPAPDVEAYVQVLGERDALDAAMNWYRAAAPTGGLTVPDAPDAVIPVRYLWGTEDGSVGRVAAELTVQHVRGPYEFIELPGGTHFLTDDASAPVVRDAIVQHALAVSRG